MRITLGTPTASYTLSGFLRQLREAEKLSQEEAARRAGRLDVKSIERWETGQTLPKRDKLHAYLTALNATWYEAEIAYRLAGDVKALEAWQENEKLWAGLLGESLREARWAKGWSERDLAERARISVQTISHYENHRRTPDPVTLLRLEQVLGIPLRTVESVPEGLDHDGWNAHLDTLEQRMIAAPRNFLGSSVLRATMDRLLFYANQPPYDREPLFRLLRLWAGWADSQGNFSLVANISHRMVNEPIVKRGDSTAVRLERIRGRMYQFQMAIHHRHFREAKSVVEDAYDDLPSGDYEGGTALRIQILRDESRLYREQGNFAKAQSLAEKALRVAEQGSSPKIIEFCALNLARIVVASGDSSAQRGDAALNLLPRIPVKNTVSGPTLITYLIGYADIYARLGLWGEATPHLHQAKEIAGRHHLQYRVRQIKELERKFD